MRKFLTTTLFASLMAFNVSAQEAAPAAEPAVAPAQQQRAARPQEITRNVHEDWQLKCSVGENQQCYMSQLILGPNGSALMEVTLIPANDPNDSSVSMLATIVAPLNINLKKGIYLQVDENDPDLLQFDFCSNVGCYTRFPITDARVNSYKAAGRLFTVIHAMNNPQQGVEIAISLLGFTAAHKELMEIEAAAKN